MPWRMRAQDTSAATGADAEGILTVSDSAIVTDADTPLEGDADGGAQDEIETNWFLTRKEVVSSAGRRERQMAGVQVVLDEAMTIEGALGAALVDSESGLALATSGDPEDLDLHAASAGNSGVVQAKLATMHQLGLEDRIEDILITLGRQYHLIRTSSRHEGMFLYLVLDKSRSNLAMARFRLAQIERRLAL